jgi:hypothetical protein
VWTCEKYEWVQNGRVAFGTNLDLVGWVRVGGAAKSSKLVVDVQQCIILCLGNTEAGLELLQTLAEALHKKNNHSKCARNASHNVQWRIEWARMLAEQVRDRRMSKHTWTSSTELAYKRPLKLSNHSSKALLKGYSKHGYAAH